MRFSAANWLGLLLLLVVDTSASALTPSIQFFEASPVALSGSGHQVLLANVRTEQAYNSTALRFSSISALWDLDDRSYSFISDEDGTGNGFSFTDLSSDGTTVVGGTGFSRLNGGDSGAFRWRADSGFEQLEDVATDATTPLSYSGLRTSTDGTDVVGISHDGFRISTPRSSSTRRWNAAGNLEEPIEDPPNRSTILLAISDDGRSFAGFEQNETETGLGFVSTAIRWTEEGGTEQILPETLRALSSSASVLSGDGRVAFGRYRPDSPEFSRVFVEDAENGFIDLGHLLPNAFTAEFLAASEAGGIAVGNASYFGRNENTLELPTEAVLWNRVSGARSLAEILEGLGVNLKGARLSSAIDISADGTHILGRTSDGFAFIAIIPEPSPALLIGLGLAGLCATSNRFRKQHNSRG